MTKLAQLIAREEGYFRSGALPERNNNPGDLRHSPHSQHPGDPNAIGVIDSVADGWADLDRQLWLDSRKLTTTDPETGARVALHAFTLRDAIYSWAPPSDGNDSARYLADVVAGFGGVVDADTPLSQVLEIAA